MQNPMPGSGPLPGRSKAFLEKIFYSPAGAYGFMGKKPISRMTGVVNRGKVTKVRGTGNYLYKGQPKAMYEQIRTQVGGDVVLTLRGPGGS